MSIVAQCQEICAEILDVDADDCVEEADFVEDLGADSLDMVEIAMRLEVDLGIEVSELETERLSTFGDLIVLVERKAA